MRMIWNKFEETENMILSQGVDHILAHGRLEAEIPLRAGDLLAGPDCSVQLQSHIRLAGEDGLSVSAWTVRKTAGKVLSGGQSCVLSRRGFSLAWITLSDKGSRGERVDTSGPAIRDTVMSRLDISLARGVVIPDESFQLKACLVDFCLEQGFDLVFTTGGTGVGPRDITPEVTLPLLDKRLPGFERAMTQASLSTTPHAMISRAVAGIMGASLVVNLPGSPKAVRENLQAILPALQHTVEKLQGDPRDCGQ
jgi:molybdenum cofactor synthesis domain-containing protein